MSNGIYWSAFEWNKLAVEWSAVRVANPGKGKVACFNEAMHRVITPERWRKITAWSEVEPKLLKTGKLNAHPKPARRDDEVMIDTKAARREAEARQREQNPIQVAAETLIAEIAKEVAGTIGLLVMDEVRRQLDGAIKGLDKRILDALPKQTEPATPSQQHITVQTVDAVPEGVNKVAIAPRDRKPRICVAGLMNQQINDVRREFGSLIDMSFVKSDKGSGSDVDAYRNMDVVICMTRFSSHAVEREAKSVGAPLVRITGAVSALKRWLRSWINNEIAITEAA